MESATKTSLSLATIKARSSILRDYLGFTYQYGITGIMSMGAILVFLQQPWTVVNYISALKS